MTKRAHRLKSSALTCLLMVWPLLATQARGDTEQTRLDISRTAPLEPDDTLQRWFKEQDRILDDILLHLSRIENLVRDLHRLIQQLPVATDTTRQNTPPAQPAPAASAPPATTTAAKTPVTPPPPVTPIAPVSSGSGMLAFFDKWGTLLATGGILLLVLMMAGRRRRESKTKIASPATADMPSLRAVQEPALATSVSPAVTPAPRVTAFLRTPEPAPRPVASSAAVAPQPSRSQPLPATEDQHDQAMELAEIMLSMGLGHGAAQTLTEQIRSEPKQALRYWLKLLEIYRQNGQQTEFEHAAEELRQHFNVQPEDWNARPEARRSLEDYPHIATRLTDLWGKPSCLTYLQNLLDDNRGGARSGFPQSVAEELLLLTAILKADGIVPEADAAIDSVQGR